MAKFDKYAKYRKWKGTCKNCGKKLVYGQQQFCSNSCKNTYNMVGTRNPNYGKTLSTSHKKKISDSNKDTRNNYVYDPDTKQPEYRRKAIEYYGYKCELCNESEGMLHVHHIDNNHSNDDLANLVVLCPSCHNRIHRNRNVGDSTPDPDMTARILESRKSIVSAGES